LQTMSREPGILIARRGEKEWAVGGATAATAVYLGTVVDKFPEKWVHENQKALVRMMLHSTVSTVTAGMMNCIIALGAEI
jgi:hypothetical protein